MSDEPMVVLFSGGLDSRIHLHWAQQQTSNITTLYVNFGHKYAKMEMEAAKACVEPMGIPLIIRDIPLMDVEQEDSYLPLRNLYLLQLCTIYADNIVFGMLYNESPPDKRPKFVRKMESLLNSQFQEKQYYYRSRSIRILTPFQYQTKTEMLRWYIQNALDAEEEAKKTIGCYSPEGHCGRCISCFNRWIAFTNNGLRESYRYPPYKWAVEQLVFGKKKRQSLTALSALWFKRYYIAEIYSAYAQLLEDPMRTAWQVHKQKSVEPFLKDLHASSY
jgi:7-cyano-7-deazaguanine synthase in queuosine biosynthesis